MLVFCFPHAGAGPSLFHSWRLAGLDVVPVALPGRENRFREAPLRRLDAVVNDIIKRIEPSLRVPFTLMGHSMGALLAFELARELRRRQLPQPERLFVSAFRAPHLPEPRPPLHALSDQVLKAELLRLDGTPAEVLHEPELMDALLPALRADLEIADHYRYTAEAPLACPVSCFGGLTDRRVTRFDLAAWRRHTSADFRLRFFPGAHFYLYKMPVLVQRAICADLGMAVAGVVQAC
jgi:medium-chain acyl-[acyl-carrier-protein] hydrolase